MGETLLFARSITPRSQRLLSVSDGWLIPDPFRVRPAAAAKVLRCTSFIAGRISRLVVRAAGNWLSSEVSGGLAQYAGRPQHFLRYADKQR